MDAKQIEKMISLAAARLNMSPEQLKTMASSGNVDGILSRLDGASADKIRSAMADKKLTEDLKQKFNK